ncbi:tRNA (adenosine(37)-N6)-dimethylallyltransferase MiaA [Candidatus Dojkabacteria bacterium]|nr:tRNA (adenosine(37)-N6)-dimethylallyltransferase MiaA [Candidatus Dojkabacteria bacterium]
MSKIIAIGGLTSSGKSSLGIKIAKKFDGEIINADSRQIYRYLDIGTGKEPVSEHKKDGTVIINGIIHHLIDILDPDEDYNLATYKKKTESKISEIADRDKLPILVGGTGLYLDAVVYNYALEGNGPDLHQREYLQSLEIDQLQKLCHKNDPRSFSEMNQSDKKNPHRLIRCIERSQYKERSNTNREKSPYTSLYLCRNTSALQLENQINDRVEEMFKTGLLEENKKLREQGFSTEMSSMKTIGYREFDEYFSGNITLEETKSLIKTHTRQYAKRQMTWFKRNPDITWFKTPKKALELVSKFLSS